MLPWVSRLSARSHIMSSAFWARPMGAHRVVDASSAQPGLGDRKRLPFPPEQLLRWNSDVVIVDEGVRSLVARLAREADVANDVDARRTRSSPLNSGTNRELHYRHRQPGVVRRLSARSPWSMICDNSRDLYKVTGV